MLRTAISSLAVLLVLSTVAGCPDRAAVVDQVGGAPGRQVQDARVRANRAEDKIKDNAAAASAVGSE
jgi:hypothetical protein